MTKTAKGTYEAKIPPQKAKQIVRFRVRAVDGEKAERYFPHPNELRPALSVYVHEPFKVGECPFGMIINVGASEFLSAKMGMGGFNLYRLASPNPPGGGNRRSFTSTRRRGSLRYSTSSASARAAAGIGFGFIRIVPWAT